MSNHPGFRFPIPKHTMWMWSSLLITSQTLLLIRKWKLYFKLQEKCKLQGVRAKIPAEFCFPSMILFLTMHSEAIWAVSLSLLHSHICIIYEANMRHIWEKYAAFMMQISIIFSKNEVLSTTIFEYCQNIIKLLFLMFQCTVVKP